MKVALVSQEYPPETAHGGIASQTLLKARGLAGRGHEVHVVSHSVDERRHERMDDGVHVIRIPGPDAVATIHSDAERWIAYSELVADEVAALGACHGLDLVDFPDWGAEGYAHLLQGSDVAAAVHIHGPLAMFVRDFGWPAAGSELQRVGMDMEGTCLRRADVVFSASGVAADRCASEYGLRREDIEVLHLGVDTGVFRPVDVPAPARPTVLFVGKVAENKGVALLVEAWLRLGSEFPGLRLRLVGRGEAPFVARTIATARAAGRERDLEMAGFVPADALPRELAAADVVALPSYFEGGPGLTALEAMACGKPVVASEGTGTAEVIEHGVTGMLVPVGDAPALTSAMRTLLGDQHARAAIGGRARRMAEEHLDFRARVAALERIYERGIARARGERVAVGGSR